MLALEARMVSYWRGKNAKKQAIAKQYTFDSASQFCRAVAGTFLGNTQLYRPL